jgi:predicted dehydrogenase
MVKKVIFLAVASAIAILIISCTGKGTGRDTGNNTKGMFTGKAGEVMLMTLNPGHFHAALVQKSMYDEIDPVVHVYAPGGPEVKQHLEFIESYNTREENPTRWKEEVYTGSDYLEKMLSEKPGNVVVLAGNNQKKTEYILRSLEAGINVLADKPMAIDAEDFEMLKKAFAVADKGGLLLYDIMTERYEITTIMQRELSMIPAVFGTLEEGTTEDPAVTKESVHHLFKYVSGKPLVRPPWFLDESQQGGGLVDVTTHLVDLIQWECFPGRIIDYENDIRLLSARQWATELDPGQFENITKMDTYPDYLKKNIIRDSILAVPCNGEINYTLFGVHAKVSVKWAYQAPEGTGDTHYSITRGSRANLVIRQGIEERFIPTLYIEPVGQDESFASVLEEEFKALQDKYPGMELRRTGTQWVVVIPDQYRVGHEAHFAQVTERFLEYLVKGNMPDWEVPNMIAKYYTTTHALSLAEESGQ